jgi:hypothetical protein
MKTRLRRRTLLARCSLREIEAALAREQLAFRQQRQRLLKRYAGE